MKFFENIAIMPTTTGTYQERFGDIKSPIILPVTSDALGKNNLIFRSFTNKRSEETADKIDKRYTRRTFCDGLLINAVTKISVRRIPN